MPLMLDKLLWLSSPLLLLSMKVGDGKLLLR
jgi:hypothetical protein